MTCFPSFLLVSRSFGKARTSNHRGLIVVVCCKSKCPQPFLFPCISPLLSLLLLLLLLLLSFLFLSSFSVFFPTLPSPFLSPFSFTAPPSSFLITSLACCGQTGFTYFNHSHTSNIVLQTNDQHTHRAKEKQNIRSQAQLKRNHSKNHQQKNTR